MKGTGKLKLTDVSVSEAEKKDPALHMEMQTLRAEREEKHNAMVTQLDREQAIAEAYETAGVFKALQFVEKVMTGPVEHIRRRRTQPCNIIIRLERSALSHVRIPPMGGRNGGIAD